jgi:hypothetical protein
MFENFRNELDRLTLFEKIVGSSALVSLVLAAFSISENSQLIQAVREISLVLFFASAAAFTYKRYLKKQYELKDALTCNNDWDSSYRLLNSSFESLFEHQHNISHTLRDGICRIANIRTQYNKKMSEFILKIASQASHSQQNGASTGNNEEDFQMALSYAAKGLLLNDEDFEEATGLFPDIDPAAFLAAREHGLSEIENLKKVVATSSMDTILQMLSMLKKILQERLHASGFKDEEVCVAVKNFKVDPDKRNITRVQRLEDLKVFTYLRDHDTETSQKRAETEIREWTVSANSAFRECYEGQNRVGWSFVKNNLKALYDERLYKNERKEFWKIYNSAIVVPIQEASNSGNASESAIYGFLGVDCKNEKGHKVFLDGEHLHIVAHVADAISAYQRSVDLIFPGLFAEGV